MYRVPIWVLFANIRCVDDEQRRALRHDLRSPLVVITGFSQLLQQPDLAPADRQDYAGRILKAAQDLEAVIEQRL